MNHFTRLKTLIFMGLTQNTIILAAPAIPEEMLKMPITTISIEFNPADLNPFGTHLSAPLIEQQIAVNLRQWSFPIQVDNPESSHRLLIKIGEIHRGSTPVGFSFNTGNSDPRALDFQKADVMPISCSLFSTQQPSLRYELTRHITAPEVSAYSSTTLTPLLINQLSTVCFDLLDKWPHEKLAAMSDAHASRPIPNWLPGIRMTIQENALPKRQPLHSDETDNNSQDMQKTLMIHNNGDPVSITLGYERK